ncbi:MAG: hypothetical protein ACK4S4_15140 [Pyrinomonadaceae bacterium]
MPSNVVSPKDKRRIQRVTLPLPTRVEVKIDPSSSWTEITRLADVSAFGAGFQLKRPIKRGRLAMITTPMPRQLRCFDHSEPQYRVWALVRRCFAVRSPDGERSYVIGVAFVGKNPPQSYIEDPARLYDISHREEGGLWQIVDAPSAIDQDNIPKEARRQTRLFIPEAVTLELLDPENNVVAVESTVTENVSLGGAAVFTTLRAEAGNFVRVTSERHGTKIISVVRGRRTGPDGLPRLHLEFIDHFFPLEGIE